jgi:hypothetical protein
MKIFESKTRKYRILEHTQRDGEVYYTIDYKFQGGFLGFWGWSESYLSARSEKIRTQECAEHLIKEAIEDDNTAYKHQVVKSKII